MTIQLKTRDSVDTIALLRMNSIWLGGTAHGVVTKTLHKLCQGMVGIQVVVGYKSLMTVKWANDPVCVI